MKKQNQKDNRKEGIQALMNAVNKFGFGADDFRKLSKFLSGVDFTSKDVMRASKAFGGAGLTISEMKQPLRRDNITL